MGLEHLGTTARMGPLLQKEVETQLLQDLSVYGFDPTGLSIDWSQACQEGHCTRAMDGNLEDLSAVAVVTSEGTVAAEGWMDFIHGGVDQPLFVFWLFLYDLRAGKHQRVKTDAGIPAHVWARLADSTKRLLATDEKYDARWSCDPLVKAWRLENDG